MSENKLEILHDSIKYNIAKGSIDKIEFISLSSPLEISNEFGMGMQVNCTAKVIRPKHLSEESRMNTIIYKDRSYMMIRDSAYKNKCDILYDRTKENYDTEGNIIIDFQLIIPLDNREKPLDLVSKELHPILNILEL